MIKIICVGKIKEKFYIDALEEYRKRLSKYTKLEIIEVGDENDKNPHIILEKEKMKIQKHIGEKDYVITLEIEGKEFTSLEFAQKLDQIYLKNSIITFIIGGSYGIHEDIKKDSHLSLSFSKLTFPHQLFRIVLLEQIYRCFKIMHHETYHK